jgi:glutathione peroxidase
VVLVVNTASQCGYTPQYRGLETLFQRYAPRGLVVLGFPSNDFAQELSTNEAIADFCENQFGLRFPLFAPGAVAKPGPGVTVNPLFVALAARAGGPPRWNFHKYLVSRDGATVLSRPSATDPLDPGFIREIERLLDQKMN